jgi:hypothetical protein
MLRGALIVAALLSLSIQVQAQLPTGQKNEFISIRKSLKSNLNPLADNKPGFLDPKNSLLTLQRQADIQFMPPGFIPKVETETDPDKRKALRYAIAFYRDSEVGGINGLVDVMVGLRFDTRNGMLEIKYFSEYTVININRVQVPDDRPFLAILPDREGSVLLFFLDGIRQNLITFEGIFTDNAKQVNFITTDDIDGIKTDEIKQKFAIFVRGGAANGSLFVLNTDTSLKDVEIFEVIKSLPATDRAYIFGTSSGAVPYRGVIVSNKP